MTIREVSAMTGMREDTLRYYEQIGVIPQVPRNKWGVRTYQEPVLQKIFLVQKLKAAGMPLKGINKYKSGSWILRKMPKPKYVTALLLYVAIQR